MQTVHRPVSRAVLTLILILATFAIPTFRTVIVRGHEANLRDERVAISETAMPCQADFF